MKWASEFMVYHPEISPLWFVKVEENTNSKAAFIIGPTYFALLNTKAANPSDTISVESCDTISTTYPHRRPRWIE